MNCPNPSVHAARPSTSYSVPRPRNLYSKNPHVHFRVRAENKQNSRTKVDRNDGFDSLELNKEYYKEMGITAEQAAEQLDQVLNEAADGFRPVEEEALSDEDFYDDDEPPFGPPALLLAGFRDHELAMVRITLDNLGAHAIRVIPCVGNVLHGSVAAALDLPEPAWEEPKPAEAARSGDWGSQRTVLFSGLENDAMTTLLDILEESGLPTLCVAIAEPENESRVLGEVLAEAVKTQRGRGMMNYSLANMVSKLPNLDSSTDREGSEQAPPEGRSSAASGTAAAGSREETPAETSQPDAAIIAKQETSETGIEPSMLEEPLDSKEAEELVGLQAEDWGQQLPATASQTAAASRPGTSGPLSSQLASENQEETSARPQTSNPLAGRTVGDSSPPPVAGSAPAAANAPGKRTGPESRSPSISSSNSRDPRDVETAIQLEQPARNGTSAAHSEAAGGVGGGDDEEKSAEAISTAGKDFMADITKNASEGREQQLLREAAAEDMRRRSEAQRRQNAAAEEVLKENLIDAVASGEDPDSVLKIPAADPMTKEEAARKQMEAVLEKMKLDASQLPEEQRQKLAEDLKVLEGNKDTVEQVLSDLGASLNSVPRRDRNQLKAKLKEEAWLPTKAAIGAALACGITADEVRGLVDEAVEDASENRGWYPTIATLEKRDADKATAAARQPTSHSPAAAPPGSSAANQ